MRRLLILGVGIVLIYVFSSNNNSSSGINDNYGKYDKGTPLCDEDASGDC